MFAHFLRSLSAHRRGSVAVIFAVALVPLVLMVGVGVDYTSAADRQAQLNAATDAAALAAVTPSMMAQSTSNATTVANNTFNAQASTVNGVTNAVPTVAITTSGSCCFFPSKLCDGILPQNQLPSCGASW